MKNKIIGIIAEDDSDIETLAEIIKKKVTKPFSIKRQVGRGCGKIKKKCNAWALNLKQRQCSILILLHDLDRNNYDDLLKNLQKALEPCSIQHNYICIAVEEVEAWLLSDPTSIQKTFNLKKKPKIPNNPETIKSPKEYLEKLVYSQSANSKIYLNTKHNAMIAKNISLTELNKKCRSFSKLATFLDTSLK